MTAATISPEEVESLRNVAQSGLKNGCRLSGPGTVESAVAQDGDEKCAAEGEEGLEEALLKDPHSRLLGGTEQNWCKAVASGTGVTVLALLFSNAVDASGLQYAINEVQQQHPRLRSKLLWINGRPAFKVSKYPCVTVKEIDATSASIWEKGAHQSSEDEGGDDVEVDSNATANSGETDSGDDSGTNAGDERTVEENGGSEARVEEDKTAGNQLWLRVVEAELNTNIWPDQHHDVQGEQVFVVRLYRLPDDESLVILRSHTAACDRAGAALVLVDILRVLEREKGAAPRKELQLQSAPRTDELSHLKDLHVDEDAFAVLPSVEDAIPKGQANKPFWAHGVDLLGYSLGSRRHASLPFEEPDKPRRSGLIVSTLSKQETKQLLQACAREKTCLYGAINAAAMKAVAALKQTGNRGEHYAVVSLIDCRKYMESNLPDPAVGFYHSALLNTHHVTETAGFWELARRGSNGLGNALKNRKHFTDMGNLNFLMSQAILHPNLTPYCSLRTSLLVLFKDDIQDDLYSLRASLGLKDYLGCSSIHGVGPSLAVFHSIRSGSLHCANLYPEPLHSRTQMQQVVSKMMEFLRSAQ